MYNRTLTFSLIFGRFSICFIHFEINGDPGNLIGSQQCDLFPNNIHAKISARSLVERTSIYPKQWRTELKFFYCKKLKFFFGEDKDCANRRKSQAMYTIK